MEIQPSPLRIRLLLSSADPAVPEGPEVQAARVARDRPVARDRRDLDLPEVLEGRAAAPAIPAAGIPVPVVAAEAVGRAVPEAQEVPSVRVAQAPVDLADRAAQADLVREAILER